MYAEAHKTTFERAKELISQSKKLAKRELQVENSEKLNMSNSESDKTQKDDNAYVPVQGEIISYYVRVGRDMLKEIYSTLSEDQPNRVQEFSRLYKALSECSKKRPTNVDEENDKLRELQTLYEEIEMFKAMGTEAPVVPSI